MSKTLRLSEKWFRRGLWVVAVVFASFLIGLGGTVVGDLPQVEQPRHARRLHQPPGRQCRAHHHRGVAAHRQGRAGGAGPGPAAPARWRSPTPQSARETFNNWLATRRATERPEQDPELIARTQRLDALKAAERAALAARAGAAKSGARCPDRPAPTPASACRRLEDDARAALQKAQRAQELRVFLYRLALTLPLLAAAGWLFAKKRKGTYWPFVWGFIYFALFAFFVELVPYLPSYGGYVRYVVGIVLTVLVGRYAILALNRYLERQKLAEQLPDAQRREELSYDVALARLAKGVCPGCERVVDLKDPKNDFCPHCGIGLHDHCGHCERPQERVCQVLPRLRHGRRGGCAGGYGATNLKFKQNWPFAPVEWR